MIESIMKRLAAFAPVRREGCVDVTLPVVMYIDGGLLELRIIPDAQGYTVASTRDLFCEANGDQEFYFSIFSKWAQNEHYGMQIRDGVIYKTFDAEYSVTVALDECIRFFITLDQFIINNGVIGSEENFPI